jgi:hypothetical protein
VRCLHTIYPNIERETASQKSGHDNEPSRLSKFVARLLNRYVWSNADIDKSVSKAILILRVKIFSYLSSSSTVGIFPDSGL